MFFSSAATAAAPDQPAAVWTRIRLANSRDIPHIHRLIHQMEFEKLTHLFADIKPSLSSTLFPSPQRPAFLSFTVLIFELSPNLFSQGDEEDKDAANPFLFCPIVRRVELKSPEGIEVSVAARRRGGGGGVRAVLPELLNLPGEAGAVRG